MATGMLERAARAVTILRFRKTTVLMQVNMRRKPRKPSKRTYSISWKDENGLTHSAQVRGTDVSESGIGLRCPVEIQKGTIVYIQGEGAYPKGYSTVRHATQRGEIYLIGLELDEETRKNSSSANPDQATDYYEFLQINPKAQAETIQRVYRFLAARYHPDNPETGDPENFLRLNRAYETLSDPVRRTRYDDSLKGKPAQDGTLFGSVDFLDGVEGEVNRRLAVLSLLYRKCRSNVSNPQISLLELEAQMGFPREYLDFTIWYLRNKKFVKQEDNAEISLTCLGVDFIEENYEKSPTLRKLLDTGFYPRSKSRSETDEQRSQPIELHRLSAGEPVPEQCSE